MTIPHLGEIRIFAGTFAPVGWARCDGTLLPIYDNEALFTLLGTTYGGDGVTTFAVPNLSSSFPMHQGSAPWGAAVIGQAGGSETVTLTQQQMPSHSHTPLASTGAATTPSPQGAVWAPWPDTPYGSAAPATSLAPSAVAPAGGNLPHENMSPFVAMTFIIATAGIFPSFG